MLDPKGWEHHNNTVELKPGVRFNQLGKWYVEIENIIKQNDKVALVACHEDDNFKKYYVFKKRENGWEPHISSTQLDAAEYSFNLANY